MDYPQQKITPYGSDKSKTEQIEQMFDNIAPTYDKLNITLSMGIDRYWRKKAVDSIKKLCPKKVMDVATGTGDFAILTAKRLKPNCVYATDISEGMMNVGREKAAKEGLQDIIHFQKEDCANLSFEDGTFDAVTVTFGVRNFENLDRGLSEIYRVLRKGGKLVILELTTPEKAPFKQMFNFYSNVIIRKVGGYVSRDKKAYDYLPKTMEAFPQGEEMKRILHSVGYEYVSFERMTFGICTLYVATK